MSLDFVERSGIDRSEWDAFVDANDEAWLWHRTDFISARSGWKNCSDGSFGVVSSTGELLAVVPLFRTVRLQESGAQLAPCSLLSFGGPVIVSNARPNLRRKVTLALNYRFHEIIEQYRAEFIEARVTALAPFLHSKTAPRANPLFHFGFENESGATWMVDLAPTLEDIRRNYSETTKQLLKKGSSDSRLRVREAQGGKDLEIYYNLHLQTARRQQADPEPLEFFLSIFEQMQAKGHARIAFLEQNDRVIAANVAAVYKRGAYYWLNASADERQGFENRMLLDDQVMHARASGCLQFEVGKAYIAGDYAALVKGSSDFKRSFGSELVNSYGGRIHAMSASPPASTAHVTCTSPLVAARNRPKLFSALAKVRRLFSR